MNEIHQGLETNEFMYKYINYLKRISTIKKIYFCFNYDVKIKIKRHHSIFDIFESL
jgi:hypothetical protein